MSTRLCPKCKLVNPESAALCDCGHVFDGAGAEAARAAGFKPRSETHPPGVKVWVTVVAGLLGFLLGAFPVYFALEIRELVGERGEFGGAARVLGLFSGLAGMSITLFLVTRWHRRRVREGKGNRAPS